MLTPRVFPTCKRSSIIFRGVYLLDLTFIGDGNPDNIDGLINFSKRTLESEIIIEIQQYQDVVYNLKADDDVALLLSLLPASKDSDEKKLYQLSLKREPRPQKV